MRERPMSRPADLIPRRVKRDAFDEVDVGTESPTHEISHLDEIRDEPTAERRSNRLRKGCRQLTNAKVKASLFS